MKELETLVRAEATRQLPAADSCPGRVLVSDGSTWTCGRDADSFADLECTTPGEVATYTGAGWGCAAPPRSPWAEVGTTVSYPGVVVAGTATSAVTLEVAGSLGARGLLLGPEPVERRIPIQAGSSRATIQRAIDSVGKYIPGGTKIFLEFEAGTFTLDGPIRFQGFFGGGVIFIRGSDLPGGTHATQSTVLNSFGAGGPANVISIEGSDVRVEIDNIRVQLLDGPGQHYGVVASHSKYLSLTSCSFSVNGTTESRGLGFLQTAGVVDRCAFEGGQFAIVAATSVVSVSGSSADANNLPGIGIRADNAAFVGTNGNAPLGSQANSVAAGSQLLGP